MALQAKTGEHVWYFQEVHHDIWDNDAASPVVLFDTVIDGERRKGIAQAGKTGWVYILDRTSGKPLIGSTNVRYRRSRDRKQPERSPFQRVTPQSRNAPTRCPILEPVVSSTLFGRSR